MVTGRPHRLADPEFARLVAEAFVSGASRQEIADTFEVKDLATITRWRRDPRVQQIALKLSRDRVLQITRRTDAKIEEILGRADADLTVREILDIRKEFLGGVLRESTEQVDEQTMSDAQDLLDQDPEFVDNLRKLVADSKPTKK